MAVLASGADIYSHRVDLAAKAFWRCPSCPDVYVGSHPGTKRPMGRLADLELRQAKMLAHARFDHLWKTGVIALGCKPNVRRDRAYAWLSRQLRIPLDETHIGRFDPILCACVVEVCEWFVGPNGGKLTALYTFAR